MSGGHFEHNQYHINDIADTIERDLNKQGKPKSKNELWNTDEYYVKYPEEKFHHTYPEKVQEKMLEAIKALKIAGIYAHRVDWFLSGDDGEESFLKRLELDLSDVRGNRLHSEDLY